MLKHAPITLAYAIITAGKILYEWDLATRVEFEALVLSRYGDFLPVLRMQRDQLLEGSDYANRVQRYRRSFGRTERTLIEINPIKK
jgi:hypothetical protein